MPTRQTHAPHENDRKHKAPLASLMLVVACSKDGLIKIPYPATPLLGKKLRHSSERRVTETDAAYFKVMPLLPPHFDGICATQPLTFCILYRPGSRLTQSGYGTLAALQKLQCTCFTCALHRRLDRDEAKTERTHVLPLR
ncbi:hypothetical protein TRVL_05111 [Trypanosoma vivax]|nr:hypothetical protein TRVL_05111 [Trypanosoma vivax]